MSMLDPTRYCVQPKVGTEEPSRDVVHQKVVVGPAWQMPGDLNWPPCALAALVFAYQRRRQLRGEASRCGLARGRSTLRGACSLLPLESVTRDRNQPSAELP
jgi:hypothetical protein